MAITKFIPQQVPFQASDNLRAYLDEQMQSIEPLLNNAAQRNEDEIIEGNWTFNGTLAIPQASVTDHQAALALAASQITSGTFANARIAQGNVTQHQATLTIAESQITDGLILARVASDETIGGNWTFKPQVTIDESMGSGSTTLLHNGTDLTVNNANTRGLMLRGMTHGLFVHQGPSGDAGGSVYIRAKLAALTDFGNWGQLWVKNTSPTQLWFTDDAGTDTQIV